MKIAISELRTLIREILLFEWAGAPPTKPMFDYVNNPLSPSTSDREQLGYLADVPTDVQGDDDELPSHLREPQVDVEDCFGPVPPKHGDHPYEEIPDPLTRDTSPLPTSPIRR